MLDTVIVICCAIVVLVCGLYLRFAPTRIRNRSRRYIRNRSKRAKGKQL